MSQKEDEHDDLIGKHDICDHVWVYYMEYHER